MPTESRAATAPNWLGRIARAPGRLFFLAVLALMELFGLPKVKELAPSRQHGEDSVEEVR